MTTLHQFRDKPARAKIRYILIKAMRHAQPDQFGNPTYDLNSQNIIGIVPSKSSLGTPSPPYTRDELSSSITHNDMKFDAIKEPWNEYELKDGTVIRVKLVLTMIGETSKHEVHGEPVYLVNAQPIIKGVPSDKLKKK
jgi:hypothetical protein